MAPGIGARSPWQAATIAAIVPRTGRVASFLLTPERPFALCGGMLGATARHPQDAELEFRMLLLGARTGS